MGGVQLERFTVVLFLVGFGGLFMLVEQSWEFMLIGGAGLLGLLLLVMVPILQVPDSLRPDQNQFETLDKFHEARTNARTTLAQILGGILLLISVAFTYSQLQDARRALEVTQQRQVADRFGLAASQLDVENGLSVRLGGIYALEQIARDDPDGYYWPSMQLLAAYIREQTRRDHLQATEAGDPFSNGRSASELPVDVQAALTVLGRREDPPEDQPIVSLNLMSVSLPGSNLASADLRWVNLQRANLRQAILDQARLDHANLAEADLNGVSAIQTCLFDTELMYADLTHTNLTEAIGLSQEQFKEAIQGELTQPRPESLPVASDISGCDSNDANQQITG